MRLVRINVKLMGWMRQYLAAGVEHFHEQHFDLTEGMTLGELSDKFGFRTATAFVAMRNGDHVADDALDTTVMEDGDEVMFVPPLKGG